MDRIDVYLHETGDSYQNTEREKMMCDKVDRLYQLAESYRKTVFYAQDKNLDTWRKAYLGSLNALKRNGDESARKSRNVRKCIFEFVESKIDNSVPMPKMTPRDKTDLDLIDITENYLKFEMDKMMSEQENDRGERATYIDGTSWYKVYWDPCDSTHNRNGDVKVEILLADQVVPEPGVKNYKDLNYVFEKSTVQTSVLYDLYGRTIMPDDDNCTSVNIITYYFKNEKGIIGRFMYAAASKQVITWDEDWQIRKVRKCKKCGSVVPQSDYCPECGNDTFEYDDIEQEVLQEDIVQIHNPYAEGKSDNPQDDAEVEVFAKAGTPVPYYSIRQLPFVPRVSVSTLDSIYGLSEVYLEVEMQDNINKVCTKMVDKILQSGTVVTTPSRVRLSNKDDTIKILPVKTAEEAAMVQAKQLMADVQQDLAVSATLYESARATSGITNSFQGKHDTTAVSGKAKELNVMQTTGRLESLRVMKSAAYQGVYELMFKFLLAFSDENRKFTKILPDGKTEQMMWNKYMFLRKDKYGNFYYDDDFAYGTDPAASLSNNRVQMWQETTQQFTLGTMGNPQDPRTLELYWNIMQTQQYPLAKMVKAGIQENSQHLPPELEQALLQNPEILQAAMAVVNGGEEQRGGARPNSGPAGNGQTHAANVNKTNSKNSEANKRQSDTHNAQLTGGNI